MYIDGVLPDGDRLEQVRIYVRDNNITDYIIWMTIQGSTRRWTTIFISLIHRRDLQGTI